MRGDGRPDDAFDETGTGTGSVVVGRDSIDSVALRRASVDPLLGATINGRFRVLGVIARGGMGKVYRAEQNVLGRICALKVLSPKYEGERIGEFHKRFSLEAATVSKLTHQNTVRVFDFGYCEQHDVFYIAMEFIEGRTLSQALKDDGPFGEERVCNIVSQVCRSLREAHGVGVVHRDLKPSNLLLIDRGDELEDVKVLDFGLVKDFTGLGEDLTETGMFMGSPKYMAPEQILGQPVGPATDVYSIGILMYEMLAGRVPFDKGVGTLVAHINERVPSFSELTPARPVSPEVAAVVMRCLEKDPAKRYGSMRELLLAIKYVGGGSLSMTETQELMPRVSLSATGEPAARATSEPAPPSATFSGTALPGVGRSSSVMPQPTTPPRRLSVAWVAAPVAMVLVLGAFAAVKLGGPGADVKSEALASPATSGAPVLEEPVVVPPNVAVRLLRVDTEPPGAVVKENGRQLCSTTPCRVALLGPDAATRHKLTIDKPGFKTAALDIDETQEKALAKLEFAMSDGPHVDAPAQPVAATEAPVVPPPAPTHLDAPVTAATVAGSVAPPPPPPVATAAPVAATGPMQFGEGMNRPTMLSGQNVVYSREALEAKVEGLILVKCTIQPDGAVNGCRIIRGLPFMDQPVLAAMATRRYTPILYQGKAIAVDYVFNIKLKLP